MLFDCVVGDDSQFKNSPASNNNNNNNKSHRGEAISTTPVNVQETVFASDEGRAVENNVCCHHYDGYRSEEVVLPQHVKNQLFDVCGEDLVSFTKADISQIQEKLIEYESYRSEVNVDDIYNSVRSLGDSMRDAPSQFMDQLNHLSKLVKVLSDNTFMDSVKFDARFLADISSQALIAFQLLSANPTMTNITLVFTSMLTKLELPRETLTKCIEYIKDVLHIAIASIATLGYKSESVMSNFVGTIKNMCGNMNDLVQDEVVDIVLTFFAKLVSFWATLSGGFTDEDFNISNLPKIVEKMRSIISSGGDLVECMLGAYEWVIDNFPKFIKGDFSGLFFGKAETSAFETRVSKVKKMYPIVASGSTKILKEEYNHTYSSYDSEVDKLVNMGDRMMKKAKPAQRPALKRMIDELREIQTDRRLKQSQTQTKMSAIGICFVGGSGVGKSLLMDQTSRTLIRAAGETPTSDKIVTGQMSDKFDSNELPHHLSIQYDDVANNSNNENFDKLLNAVNSQARPFLKAGVDEKGIMFPGNLACVISTNVPGINAQKSNCPDSIARRFLHVDVKIKPDLIPEVCVPGTKRVDPVLANKDGRARMDIWQFTVYEFITFEFEPGEEIPEGVIEWEGMFVREIEWTTKPLEEQTYWDFALYLKDRAKKHYKSQRELLEKMLQSQDEELCEHCCIPTSICVCHTKSEFICGTVDTGIDRLVQRYNSFHDTFTHWWDIAKWRSLVILAYGLAPINYKRNLKISFGIGLYIGLGYHLSPLALVGFLTLWIILSISVLIYLSWRNVYRQVEHRVGILTHLAENSLDTMRQYRNHIFVGASMVSFAYLLYRSFKPRSELMSYREALPEEIRNSFVRAEKARTTPIDNILPHMKKDLGVMTVYKEDGRVTQALAFPIEANFYVTVGHLIPEGEFSLEIFHENGLTPTVAKQKLSSSHVYHFPKKDLVLIQIPSAVPRRGYKDFLLGREKPLGSQAINIVSMELPSMRRYTSTTRLEPGWSMLKNTVSTDKVTLHKPYKYPCNLGTYDGMCGSLIVDFSKSIIYGFHVAGNGRNGLCNTLTISEIDEALSQFRGFIPANQGDLQLGMHSLEKDVGFVSLNIGDDEHDKPVEEHNCLTEGVIPGQSATFKDPYMKHPYKDAIVAEFGTPKFAPPQEVNSDFHKRKALTKLTSPNQEFSLDELEFAADDYIAPIKSLISQFDRSKREDLARVLTLQEALDGIGEKSLGGIDNSTSNGFPFKGKKKNHLERDPLDPTIPLTPRELVDYNGVNIEEEMSEMLNRYKANKTCRPLFKCSMKTNELLTTSKKKARVFMGSNFPFLLICRQYLAPVIRVMSQNKLLFESAKGINMDSVEAEELYNFLKVEGGKRVVALDYSAFDQTMSAQASTTAAGIMVDIMRDLGCSDEHITIVRGILTDITYPNLHFFGTIMQLANSDPSGNPITTELNGMVNSLYLRIFFFRIYSELRNKVSYREAIRTATYGDDNINGVPKKYEKFNGFNIVEEGAKCGLKITMADKDADITDFTDLHDSDFLKRKFRFCPDLGRIRAPLAKDSIEKSIHWMKKTSPDTPEVLFSQNVDGMLRKASQHGRDYFEEIRGKLYRIAEQHDVIPLCKWWHYDELIQHDKYNYYDNYRGLSIYDISDEEVINRYVSEAKKNGKPPSFLWFMAKMALTMGAFTCLSVEVTEWYLNGGRDDIIKKVASKIRQLKDTTDDIVTDKVNLPYSLNGVQGVAEELGVPSFVARFLTKCLFSEEPTGFKSESFVPPLKQQNLWARMITFIMEWLIALFPFINTGRYAEIGLSSSLFSSIVAIVTCLQYFIDVDRLTAIDRNMLYRQGFSIKQLFVKHWLRENNDIIRPQATCILLEGGAGVGKTTCALALVKGLIPDILRHEIVVLNEDDDFQSELRSHHRVIILDDVVNTHRNYLQTSPMRRVIDMVNNVPRRALSPDVELKGNIKISPELVILTTNVTVPVLLSFTECPYSLMRRWHRLIVHKVKDFQSSFDTSAWRFEVKGRETFVTASSNIPIQCYDPVTHYRRDKEDFVDFQFVLNYMGHHFNRQKNEQEALVRMVNDHFPSQSYWELIKSFWFKPKYKSEALDWDAEMVEVLKNKHLTPETFLREVELAKRELLERYSIEDFSDVPTSVRLEPPLPTWWSWISTQLGLNGFRSEGKQIDSMIHLFGDDNVDRFLENKFTEFLQFVLDYGDITSHAPAPIPPISNSIDGSIDPQFERDLESCGLEVGLVKIPHDNEKQAQDEIINRLGHEVVAREVMISTPEGKYSCDLIFRKNKTYTFVEAKMNGINAVKLQAEARKKALLPYLKKIDGVSSFAYYSSSTGEFKFV